MNEYEEMEGRSFESSCVEWSLQIERKCFLEDHRIDHLVMEDSNIFHRVV